MNNDEVGRQCLARVRKTFGEYLIGELTFFRCVLSLSLSVCVWLTHFYFSLHSAL
jgi:hypothetical protein